MATMTFTEYLKRRNSYFEASYYQFYCLQVYDLAQYFSRTRGASE